MAAGRNPGALRLIAHGVIILLTIALLSLESRGGDIVGLGGELPVLEFDVPAEVVCRDITHQQQDFQAAMPGDRLIQVDVPVSVVVLRGDEQRVREVIIEIDGAEAGLTVHDFSPDTRLAADRGEVEVQRTEESRRGIDASLGGALPVAGGTAHLTPSVTAGKSTRTSSTVTETRLPPKRAVLVSGAVNRRQGVYFKLRQSSQTTLEGEHELTIVFIAPADWEGVGFQVECVGRGEQKWLFVKQRKVWGATKAPIEVRLASHTVAKPVCDCPRHGEASADTGAPIEPTAQQL